MNFQAVTSAGAHKGDLDARAHPQRMAPWGGSFNITSEDLLKKASDSWFMFLEAVLSPNSRRFLFNLKISKYLKSEKF